MIVPHGATSAQCRNWPRQSDPQCQTQGWIVDEVIKRFGGLLTTADRLDPQQQEGER